MPTILANDFDFWAKVAEQSPMLAGIGVICMAFLGVLWWVLRQQASERASERADSEKSRIEHAAQMDVAYNRVVTISDGCREFQREMMAEMKGLSSQHQATADRYHDDAHAMTKAVDVLVATLATPPVIQQAPAPPPKQRRTRRR